MNSRIIKIIFSSFLLFLYLLSFNFVWASASLDAVINEVAWMGTEASYNDEWIELYNNTNQDINLDGWELKAEDESLKINLAGIIPANGFNILERTDDDTLPKILADLIYKGSLGNSGENLKFYNSDGNLIDSVDCSKGWFGGDNETKQTMERKNSRLPGFDPDNWQTSQNSSGTPKSQNSILIKDDSSLEPESQLLPQKENQVLVYPSGIFINEILPNPEGPDETEEWIEIFNSNDFEVELYGWQLQDITGKTTIYTFLKETKISAKGFLVFERPITKIILNNDGDGVKLVNPTGEMADEISFGKTEKGKSYNRTPLESSNEDLTGQADSGWVWSGNLTPGSENVVPVQKEKPLELAEEKGLAAIGEQIPKETSFFPLLVALGIAIFSGIIILILKRKISSKNKIE